MKGLVLVTALAASVAFAAPASADWNAPVGTNVVADAPIAGGGYPVPPGATKPDPGTCRAGLYNSNRSESWVTVKPGTSSVVPERQSSCRCSMQDSIAEVMAVTSSPQPPSR